MKGPTIRARLDGDETLVRRLADAVAESFESDAVAVAASEQARGWALEVYFRDPAAGGSFRALIAFAGGAAAANALVFEPVVAQDWVKASLEGLAPVRAGRFVVHGSHDRARIPVNATGIEIEAALAFGTGHHGTTRGCLLALDALLKSRRYRRILDIGTGTGVLAIAAAKAARIRVAASDIDPRATATARENAAANRVAPFVEIMTVAGVAPRRFRRRGRYDLVFANILLGPLRRLAPPAAALIAPGGRAVLSGLLPAHAAAVISAYRAQGLALERRLTLEGWVTLVMRRAPSPKKTAPRTFCVRGAGETPTIARLSARRAVRRRSCS